VRVVASLRIYRCLASKAYVFDSNRRTFKDLRIVKRRPENNIEGQCGNIVVVIIKIIKIRATQIPGE
jgi:hypothetical protein